MPNNNYEIAGQLMDINPNLFNKVYGLNLPTRISNNLIANGIVYVGDLVQKSKIDLLKMPNLAEYSINLIIQALSDFNLCLNMTFIEGEILNIEDYLPINLIDSKEDQSKALPVSLQAELRDEVKAFEDWHYQEFCRQAVAPLSEMNKKEVYQAIYSIPANQDARTAELRVWQAATRLFKAKHAAQPEKKIIDLDKIDNETVLYIAKAFYRRALAMDGLKCPVNLDEANEGYDMQLMAHMRTALMWLELDQVERAEQEVKDKQEPGPGIDINIYLKQYHDGDVILVSDRDKFTSTLPSGVKAHWINHTRDWSFAELTPHKNAVTHIHEIFIDKAFVDETSEKEADGYIKYLIKEFGCDPAVKQTYISLGDMGIMVINDMMQDKSSDENKQVSPVSQGLKHIVIEQVVLP